MRVDEPDTSGSLGTVDSPAQSSSYEYNTQGNLIHITQGSGSTVQNRYFKFDALGRLTYERQVEQAGTFTATDALTGNSSWSRHLVYDETVNSVNYAGLLTTATDARSITTQFRYDQLNRIDQVSYSDSTPAVTNNYDQARTGYYNKGRLTEALTASTSSLPATSEVYNFDLMGRVAGNTQTVGDQSYSMSYGYSLGGALTSETYPSGRVVSYAFDDGARLSQVSSGSTVYANQFDYSSAQGLLKAVTLGNGAVESYDYNSRLQMKSIDLTKSGTQIQHYDYKYGVYDPSNNTLDETKNTGQIARIEGKIATVQQWQQNFAYDSLGRSSSAREFQGTTTSSPTWLVNYDYDVFGNRCQKQSHNSGNPFTQIWTEDSDITQTTNRFASNVTYDYAGNILTDQKFRQLKFQYDANNRQKQSSNLDDSNAVVSVFDAAGQRVATQVGNSLTNVLVYDATGKVVAEYGSPASTGGTQYLFSDAQGTPRVVTAPNGAVVSRHDYLPYGEELAAGVGLRGTNQGYSTGDNARQKYAGMEGDDSTGMSHTLWRQYDSSSGRWTSPDPYGGSLSIANPQTFNRYSYVIDDPVNQLDSSGLSLQDMGVLQTSDPAEAESAEDLALHNQQVTVNLQHASAHGGSVSYDKSGHATYIGKYSAVNYFRRTLAAGSVNVSATITGPAGEPQDNKGTPAGPGATFTFDQLWKNHPGVQNSDSVVTLCSEYAGENCAIRLSVALQRSGMDMSSFQGKTCNPTTGGSAAINTAQLANWLAGPQRLGAPEKFNVGFDAWASILNRTGIVYIRQFLGTEHPEHPQRFNHIDLWNGHSMGTGKTEWLTRNPQEVWFWQIR